MFFPIDQSVAFMCKSGQRAAAGMGVARDWRTRMKERQRFWSVSHGFKACLCPQALPDDVPPNESTRHDHIDEGLQMRNPSPMDACTATMLLR